MANRSGSTPAGTPSGEGGDVLQREVSLSPQTLAFLHAAVIVLVGLWIYLPALNGDWLWDDNIYVTENPLLREPHRLWKAWFEPGSFMEYYPIEQTVTWLQWHLWGTDNTVGYHFTNVLLHIIDALLVWRLFAKLRMPLAWVGGLLFVAHPANVESVAWISELKNTLSLAPFLLALGAWVDFEDHRRRRDYLLALGFFLVAMLCKISMCCFPGVILLYAWWKRRRLGLADLANSLPFFAISFALVAIAMHAGRVYGDSVQVGQIDILPLGGPAMRFALTGLAIAFYFSTVLLPITLLPIYPVWNVNPPDAIDFLPWAIIVAVAVWLWMKRAAWGRHGLLGLGFFLLILMPVLAFGYGFYPRDSWVMLHFLYVPMLGLIGLATAALGPVAEAIPRSRRIYFIGGVTAVIALLVFQAHAFAVAFTNNETFWTYTLERNPGAWTAHIDLGRALLLDGEDEEAKAHFEAALKLNPDSSKASTALATALIQLGRVPEGIREFQRSLAINPGDATTHNNLGVVFAETGRIPEAQQQFETASKIQPHFAEPYNNLGNTWYNLGQIDRAGELYRRALACKPDYAQGHFNLGQVLNRQGHTREAAAEYEEAIRLEPGDIAARLSLADLLARTGQAPDAARQFAEVLALDPTNAAAQQGLAKLEQPGSSSVRK